MNRFPTASRRHHRGAGALEFALSLPLLLTMLLATLDLGRFVGDLLRVTSAAVAAADLATQIETFEDISDPTRISNGKEVAILARAANEVAMPMSLASDGALIVTVMSNADGRGPAVTWARRWGNLPLASRVSAASLGGITIAAGESAVFAEVGYRFRPFVLAGGLLGLPQDRVVRSMAVRQPRLAGPRLVAPGSL